MNRIRFFAMTSLIALLSTTSFTNAIAEAKIVTAPVTGMARTFGTNIPIPNATITVLETGEKFKTDKAGRYGPINWPVNKSMTLVFEKFGFRTMQSGTFQVPKEGLTTPYNNITFQAVDVLTFSLLTAAMGKKIDDEKCHVATTVTRYHKTLDDLPQGEPNVKVALTPNPTAEVPFYFDIFNSGPLKKYTNPFTRGLVETTEDGGIAYANLEPSETPYVITATKSGKVFNQVQFLCRKGVLVNISPPSGPSVQDNLA